jgi:FMN-dependent NADH-azoreductase
MRRILHIDASYSSESSVSRVLSQKFITAWKMFHPEDAKDVQFVNAINLVLGDREQSISTAQATLQTLAAHW